MGVEQTFCIAFVGHVGFVVGTAPEQLVLLIGWLCWYCCLALLLRGLEEWFPSVSWLLILSASDYGTAGVAALDSIGAVDVRVVTSGAVASFVGAIGSVDRLFVGYVGFVVPDEAGI